MNKIILTVLICLIVVLSSAGQELQPTETEVLLSVDIRDEHDKPLNNTEIIFSDQSNGREIKKKTNEGKLQVLLLKGHQFKVEFVENGQRSEMTSLDVPNEPGKMAMQLTLQAMVSEVPADEQGEGLRPTEDKVLLEVNVLDLQGKPRPNEVIILKPEEGEVEYKGITDENGSFQILIPKGLSCDVLYKSFIESKDYAELEIPNEPGLIQQSFTLKYGSLLGEGSDLTFLLDVHFHTDKSTLTESSYKHLDELVEQLKLNPTFKIEVAGHTDSDASEAYNLKLSQERADVVKNYLVDHEISPGRIKAVGYGESKPIASNDTPDGKAKNRRTEVRITSR